MASVPYDDITGAELINAIYAKRDVCEPRSSMWFYYNTMISVLLTSAQMVREQKERRA